MYSTCVCRVEFPESHPRVRFHDEAPHHIPHPPAAPKTAAAAAVVAAPAHNATPDLFPPRSSPSPHPPPPEKHTTSSVYPANTHTRPPTHTRSANTGARDAHNPPSHHKQLSWGPSLHRVDRSIDSTRLIHIHIHIHKHTYTYTIPYHTHIPYTHTTQMYPLFFPPQLASTAPHAIAAPECFRREVDYADTCRRYAGYGGERVFRRPRPCRYCGDAGLGGERCDCSEDPSLEPGDVEVSIHRKGGGAGGEFFSFFLHWRWREREIET